MAVAPARRAALSAIGAVRARGAFAHEVVPTAIERAGLAGRDAAFATRLAYGTIATRGTLDGVVASLLANPKKTSPAILDALALSAYELLFEGADSYAAVSEGVELVRAVAPRATGVANAVLRKIAGDRTLAGPGAVGDDIASLARRTGHPEWIVREVVERFGAPNAAAILAADNEPAPMYLAHLPFRTTFDEVMASLTADGAEPTALDLPGAILVGAPAAAVRSRVLANGDVVVADLAAQVAASLVPLATGTTVLDIGSGRGTKSLLIAANARRAGLEVHVLGIDIHRFKVELATTRAHDLGADGVRFALADATRLTPAALAALPGSPTRPRAILLDAPCSGLGTLRRHPDKRWRVTPADVASLAALNTSLLRASLKLVEAGGVVVYSTCTMTREENEGVLSAALSAVVGAAVSPIHPDEVPDALGGFVDAAGSGTLQSAPYVGGPDGHFIARIIGGGPATS